MDITSLAFDEPVLTQRQAVEVDNIEMDSFIRQGVIAPDRDGRNRLFSPYALLVVDHAHLLIDQFRMRPPGAGEVAAAAAREYHPFFDADRRDIEAGASWPSLSSERGDYQELMGPGFLRDADGMLRRFQQGDDPAKSIGIVLPSRLIARRILANIAALSA